MRLRGLTALLFWICGGLLWGPSAGALTPPPPEAKVVFSNGGRILTMNADGSGREVIFGKERQPVNGYLGALEPAASPDGQSVVFALKRESGINELFDIWRVGIDGTGARRLLKSTSRTQYGDPAFMADGRVLVAFFRKLRSQTRTGLLTLDQSGKDRRNLLRLVRPNRPYLAPRMVMEPDVSNDGKRVLYLLNDGIGGSNFDEGFMNHLMVRNLASGRDRKVAVGAYEASWSPDGDLIAYSLQTENDDLVTCWWESGCEFEASLAVIRADGSSGWVVNGRGIDERNPDWSRDGRIVFHSARNLPGTGEASEIWSVRPNGRCLTPLTNGSPASLTPAWVGSDRTDTRPSRCGELPATTELEVRVPGELRSRPEILWMGERPDHRLLTDARRAGKVAQFLYYDCDLQQRLDCRPPLGQWSQDVCTYRGSIAGIFSELPVIRQQRGISVFLGKDTEIGRFTVLFAGRSTVFFFGASGRGSNFGRAEVARLRRMGATAPSGDLPTVRFPAGDVARMKKVWRIFTATRSVSVTANRTGLRPIVVRANLRFARGLKAYGAYDTVNCRVRT